MFNFKYTFAQQNLMYNMLTNFEYGLKKGFDQATISYFANPSEIYSRLNNLKMFLYRNKILKSAGDEISEPLLLELIMGKVYKSLDEKSKKEFRDSDFMEMLMFLNTKKSNKINQYVQGVSQSRLKNNIA
jgi:hypothetical protein